MANTALAGLLFLPDQTEQVYDGKGGIFADEHFDRLLQLLQVEQILDGVRLLRPGSIEAAIQEQRVADGAATDFGLGYQVLAKTYPGLGPQSFGHTGMGGFIGFADPDAKLGFGFVMNRLGSNGAAHLLAATYACLAG